MSKKRIIPWLIIIVALFAFVPFYFHTHSSQSAYAAGTSFYVDSFDGNDKNPGTKDRPWKTLNNITGKTFSPGDRILFEDGDTWSETAPSTQKSLLHPLGSGSSSSPLLISNYIGDRGAHLPLLNGNGDNATLELENQQYIEISNLEITNHCSSCVSSQRRGVWVYAHDNGTLNHIYVSHLTIHDVTGLTGIDHPAKVTGGIIFQIAKVAFFPTPTSFNDVRITSNTIYDVQRNGIFFISEWKGGVNNHFCHLSPLTAYVPSTHVLVDGNLIHDVAGNGIAVGVSSQQVISNNTAYNGNLDGYHSAGIWTIDSYNALITHNLVYNWEANNPTARDAQGFDTDDCDIGATFEYNTSHDNAGGFILTVQDSANTIVRYNTSRNDGSASHFFIVDKADDGMQVYGNTIFMNSTSAVGLIENSQLSYTARPVFRDNSIQNLGVNSASTCAISTQSPNGWLVERNDVSGPRCTLSSGS